MLHVVVVAALALASVPAPLATLERVAEEIDDAVVAQNWSKVRALAQEGDRALKARPLATPAGVHAAATHALADVQAASRTNQPLPTRRAANRLAAAVVDFYEPLHPTIPTSVMWLDVLLRQVDLAAVAGSASDAQTALAKTMAIWTPISTRPPVVGSPAARKFERQLAAVQHALGAGELAETERSAVAALEGVDDLEKVYEATTRTPR